MSALTCAARKSIDSTELLGQLPNLTVGEKFILKCSGQFPSLKTDSLKILDPQVSDKNPVPILSLLQVLESQDGGVELLVTGYRVGQYDLEGLSLTDDSQVLALSGVNWEVLSVIQQEDPQKPTEPYPTYPFWSMSYPLWFYIILAILVAFCLGAPFLIYKKIKARRKAFEDMKQYLNVLVPLDNFYKEIRKIEKQLEIKSISVATAILEIKNQLNLYITRELQLPAFAWPLQKTLKELKSQNLRLHKVLSPKLLQLYKEFEKSNPSEKDIAFFMTESQKLVEFIDLESNKKKRKK